MKIEFVAADAAADAKTVLSVGVYDKGELTPSAKTLDEQTGGVLSRAIKGSKPGSPASALKPQSASFEKEFRAVSAETSPSHDSFRLGFLRCRAATGPISNWPLP